MQSMQARPWIPTAWLRYRRPRTCNGHGSTAPSAITASAPFPPPFLLRSNMEDASEYLTGLASCIVCAMAPRYISPPCLRGSPSNNRCVDTNHSLAPMLDRPNWKHHSTPLHRSSTSLSVPQGSNIEHQWNPSKRNYWSTTGSALGSPCQCYTAFPAITRTIKLAVAGW